MKHITLTIALLFSIVIQAQLKDTSKLGNAVLDILHESEAITSLVSQHKLVMGQFQDMQQWSQGNKISEESQLALQLSYNQYAMQMNNVLDALISDLNSLTSVRQLKGAKLKRFINRFDNAYNDQLVAAATTYNSQYVPAFNTAAQEANSKSSILGSIILAFEIGETIYKSIRSLFKTGKIDKELEEQVVNLAIHYATVALDKELRYPISPLESLQYVEITSLPDYSRQPEFIQEDNTEAIMNPHRSQLIPIAHTSTITVSQPENLERSQSNIANRGEISLSSFPNDTPIALSIISKNITVGGGDQLQIPMFSTAETMQTGDRFWVKLAGYEYANFFYFDSESETWQDPFGKGIIVGGDASRNQTLATYLPSPQQYFEITGTTTQEQFLVLISNGKIDDTVRNQILNNDLEGVLFLEDISQQIPNITAPFETNSNLQTETIQWELQKSDQVYIPVFIQIEKSNNQ